MAYLCDCCPRAARGTGRERPERRPPSPRREGDEAERHVSGARAALRPRCGGARPRPGRRLAAASTVVREFGFGPGLRCRAVFCTRRAGVRGRLSLWHVFGFGSSLRIGAGGRPPRTCRRRPPGRRRVRASGEAYSCRDRSRDSSTLGPPIFTEVFSCNH